MYFEEYTVGTSRLSHGRTVTEADIVLHAGQTGDFYSHHMDVEFAKSLPGGQRIAHGTLILSMGIGMLAAGDINEQALSYGYDRVRFTAPVHIGDTIRARAKILATRDHDRRDDVGIVEEGVDIINQRDETVLVLRKLYIVNRATPRSDRAEGEKA